MSEFFYQLLNLSLAASFTMAVVLIVRLFLKRAPKIYSYLLWLAVFWRAVCPFSFSSPVSLFGLFPVQNAVRAGEVRLSVQGHWASRIAALLTGQGETPVLFTDVPGLTEAFQAAGEGKAAGSSAASSLLQVNLPVFLLSLWAAGFAILLLAAAVSYIRLRRRVAAAVRREDGSYQSDRISTAFVLGFFRPQIYLPMGLEKKEAAYVREHERVHLRRHDCQIKLLAWIITAFHWFNPLMWLSFVLMVRDMEMACDECVLKNLGEAEKRAYGSFLLKLASPRKFPSGSPLAFGESDIKMRIRNILQYRKIGPGASFLALLTVLFTFTACLSNPRGKSGVSVIGGSDGPTSLYLAEGQTDDTETDQNSPVFEFLQRWAAAVGGRDADSVYEMMSGELQENPEEYGIFETEDGIRVMGWSSPFVTEEVSPVIRCERAEDIPAKLEEEGWTSFSRAEITYPAMTSDPLWWVWKDYLLVGEKDGELRVLTWEGKDFFEIASLADAAEAYRSWFPVYTEKQGDTESFAWYLQEHYDSQGNPDYYDEFTSAVLAAENTLHFVHGDAELLEEKDGKALVSYQWPDGMAEITMIQPITAGEGGIWVPESMTIKETD